MKINVTTRPYADGTIEQETSFDYGEELDLRAHVTKQVMRTQDAQIRQALIDLGWTPPPEK